MLGFGSCSQEEEEHFVQMYGVPVTSYHIDGNVVDEAGQPIEGINVMVKITTENGVQTKYWTVDSVNTQADGKFSVWDIFESSIPSPHRVLILQDTDGEANGGTFQSDTLKLSELEVSQSEKGVNDYDKGHFILKNKIQLRKK